MFIPLHIWQTIRIRSIVHLHYWMKGFGVRFFFYSSSQALQLKPQSQKTPQSINAIVWSLVHCFIKTWRRSLRLNEMRKLLQREIILSGMILVFKLSWSFSGPLKQLLGVKKYPLGAWFLNCTLCSEQQTEKKNKNRRNSKTVSNKGLFLSFAPSNP